MTTRGAPPGRMDFSSLLPSIEPARTVFRAALALSASTCGASITGAKAFTRATSDDEQNRGSSETYE